MKEKIALISNVAGILGMVVCAVAGLFRLTGEFHVGGYEAVTLFNAGVGLMVFSALLKLELIYQANKG